MIAASSIAVAAPSAVARILLFICFIQIIVNVRGENCRYACTLDWDPVCGSNWVTYSNQCFFNKAYCNDNSLTIRKTGECQDCSHRPAIPANWDPVCGNDGITYSNIAALLAETCDTTSLQFDHDGICIGDCGHFGGEVLLDKCFYFSGKQEKFSWNDAETLCSRKNGFLARFSEYPNQYLTYIRNRQSSEGGTLSTFWVGGHDSSGESDWEWNNGVDIPLSHTEFPWGGDGDEPSGEGTENCLNIKYYGGSSDYKYTDEVCNTELQYICEIGCPFNGIIYPPGTFIQHACAQLQCDALTGRFDPHGYDEDCKKCTAWGDPHIITYDDRFEISSATGTCSLSRYGSSSPHSIEINGEFFTCGNGNVACLGDVSFKNDENTVVTCSFDNALHKIKIQVNGQDVDVDKITSSPIVINIDGTNYPVLAWTSTYNSPIQESTGEVHVQSCVSLQGSSGILVQFCGDHNTYYANSVNIWAPLDIVSGLKGFCGTTSNYDEVCISNKFGPKGDSGNSFLFRNIANCETNSSLTDVFQSRCEDAIIHGDYTAQENITQFLVDACVFDMCHVNDPEEWIGSVHAAMPKHHETKEKTVGHCVHKRTHKCKIHEGTCISKTENCNGTIIENGCHGKKCVCCAPNPCAQSSKCLELEGTCILRKDWAACDGHVNSKLCSGMECGCCYPKEQNKCRENKKCSKVNGHCIDKKHWGNCDGKLRRNWCGSRECSCCYP